MFKCFFLLVFIFYYCNGHTYHAGECPAVEPMSGFDMKQFLGVWYAIQKTSTASSCVVYNITRGEEPGEYVINQLSQHFVLRFTPIKHVYSYTGNLSVPDSVVPSKMKVKYPLSVGGEALFTVFMTDYQTYAGIFTCQTLGFSHRQSATLLSRTKELDKIYLDKMRTRLSSFNVDPYDLSIISQSNCPNFNDGNKGYSISIDDNTFSAANIASVVRKAGEKLGDGVEWTIETTKKLYSKVKSSGEQDTPSNANAEVVQDKHREFEWLP